MDITTQLDEMRSALKGCSLVAYTDLSSQLVLCTSAATTPLQEEMNALSKAAQLALDGAFADGAAAAWGGVEPAEFAMLMTGDDIRLFLRSPVNGSEALICVCGPSTDLTDASNQARATLERVQASM